jgi:fibronectin-binding autotransporter adhesin
MKPGAVLAFRWILASSLIMPAARIAGDEPPAPDMPAEYAAWETANGIAGAGPNEDSDGDGISNGIEFVIGGDPSGPDSDSNSLLPSVAVNGDYMDFVFRRTAASAGYNPFVTYSGSLGGWTMAEPGVDDIYIEEAEDFEPGVMLVKVRIPLALAGGSKLFARLCVEITP